MLRHELESRGVQPVASHIPPAQHTGPQTQPPTLGHSSGLFSGIMVNQGGSGPGLAPPPSLDQQPPQHALHPQPASAARPAGPQPPQSSFGGYPPGAAVNGMCE